MVEFIGRGKLDTYPKEDQSTGYIIRVFGEIKSDEYPNNNVNEENMGVIEISEERYNGLNKVLKENGRTEITIRGDLLMIIGDLEKIVDSKKE